MRVLFDHNVPRKLRNLLQHHTVKTARQMGWAELLNGALLSAAEADGFEVLVTADKNLSYQQNLKTRKLSLVVLSGNNWYELQPQLRAIVYAVDSATVGSFCYVEV